ncbi:MAG: lipoate--protein ligase family protein [Fibrobacterota bacterium]
MVRDSGLLRRSDEILRPVFRVYTWKKTALSCGRLQSSRGIDTAVLKDADIPCITRPTGGRGLLHGGDLCFSLSLSSRIAGAGFSREHIYSAVARRITAYLTSVGLSVHIFSARKKSYGSAGCFLIQNGYEIGCAGKKLVGMALRVSAAGYLVQGSIPVTDSYVQMYRYVAGTPYDKEVFRQKLTASTICLSDALGRDISPEQVGEGLCSVFCDEV